MAIHLEEEGRKEHFHQDSARKMFYSVRVYRKPKKIEYMRIYLLTDALILILKINKRKEDFCFV